MAAAKAASIVSGRLFFKENVEHSDKRARE